MLAFAEELGIRRQTEAEFELSDKLNWVDMRKKPANTEPKR
jgi:hypothetical protein